MMGGEEFSPASNTEPFACERLGLSTPRKRKSNSSSNNNSRRFSDEQIKSLESLFKLENKLEPRKKLQMARELGLQPRQVAIWFQNRRARWKSKQIEQEYRALKADYDCLNSKFELLKKEKNSLLLQLKNLCGESKNLEGNGTDSGSENGETNFEFNGNSSSLDGGLEQGMIIYSDDEERAQVQNLDEQVDGFSEPPERSNVFDISGLFDQPCSTSERWNVWS